jgi:hypothetical protein
LVLFPGHSKICLITLTFSSNDAAKWADGIAGGGEGGSADINGLDLQIYTA